MNQTQLMQVALKIVGIFAIIQSIPLLGSFVQTLSIINHKFMSKQLMVIGTVMPFLLMAVSGIVLISFSKKLAEKMFPQSDSNPGNLDISPIKLQTIAYSVIGLLLMLFSIPELAGLIWNYYAYKVAGDEKAFNTILDKNWNYALRTGIQFLIGFLLFFGAGAITLLWNKMVKRIQFEKKI